MPILTCPVPQNINPLQSDGFMFSVSKLPDLQYFCQEVNIPAIELPSLDMPTPLVDAPIPGDKLTFGDLDVTFLIDENMANYIAIYKWLVGLGFPKSHQQYRTFVAQDSLSHSELTKGYSDGVLQILDSANQPNRTILFRDIFPVSLQSLQLESTTTSTTYLAGRATFKYTLYEFV